ncbi:type III polyketide synthase [Curtobacterium ammoniigenes]|uniref:type III polyketide synthase n=1 Tax=Curtobacterium ammoniigenes TaxID=395387 RepID=UPI000A73AD48|nr:type III polyketide synthase [Curtobacterium ammoniigenes]
MPPVIRAIGTATPLRSVSQDRIRDRFLAQPDLSRLGSRLVRAAFDGADVAQRGTVLDVLADPDGTDDVGLRADPFVDANGIIGVPSTGFRNDRYRVEAPELFVAAAREALIRSAVPAAAVTHVITVSCTGFTQPGPDLDIVHRLGLPSTVFRHHIGFMGCAAAFPALRMAAAFCAADPTAVALVVCAELCTLHVRTSDQPDQIVANAVFADGAAAAVVTGAAPDRATSDGADPCLRIDGFATTVIPEGAPDMAWNIGDAGFEMVLSPRVPKLVQAHVREAVAPILEQCGWEQGSVAHWAVHPGGRAIVDRVEEELVLPAEALAPARRVLREHGNMSSATVLFVLDAILSAAPEDGDPVVALAFGPGLTVESAGLTVLR